MPLPVRVSRHQRRSPTSKPLSPFTRRSPPPSDRDVLTPKIVELREALSKRVGAYGAKKGVPMSEAAYRGLETSSRLNFSEHAALQDTQAWAHASGIISYTEAQIVYRALGEIGDPENGGWASETDLATKLVVQQLMLELLSIKTRGGLL